MPKLESVTVSKGCTISDGKFGGEKFMFSLTMTPEGSETPEDVKEAAEGIVNGWVVSERNDIVESFQKRNRK